MLPSQIFGYFRAPTAARLLLLSALLMVAATTSRAQGAPSPVHLSRGYFEDLALALQYKDSVRHLNLMYHGYSEFPAEILSLKNLENLDLAHNHLISIPEQIATLTNLKYLYLNDNQLKDLPVSLRTMTGLRILFIQQNPVNTDPLLLQKVPPGLERLESGNPAPGEAPPPRRFTASPPIITE